MFAGAAAVAETLVKTVYGQKWLAAADVFRPLALAMPLFLVVGVSTPLLWTAGLVNREFLAQIPILALWLLAVWIASLVSIATVGWAVFGMFVVRSAVIVSQALTVMPIRSKELWRVSRGGLVLAVTVSVAVYFVDTFARTIFVAKAAWLASDLSAGALVFLLMLLKCPSLVPAELQILLIKICSRLPNSFGSSIARHLNGGSKEP
jgi:O-antigen/teichoic acid export membrane protein